MRLKGSTVLLVMVYLTNGLAESGENLEKMWEHANLIRDRELPIICMGDLNMTPEEMQKTELVSSTGAVIKTPVRGVHLRIWKQTAGLRAGRPQAGKRGPGGTLLGRPVEISRCSGGHSLQSTAYSYNENCVHTKNKSRKERA